MTEPAAGSPVSAGSFRPALSLQRGLRRVEAVRPLYVVSGFVVAEWLATLALALTVRHQGWLFFHGGDQIWFYTTSWLLGHGQLVPTNVGYGWSILELPFALVSGPNLLQALPSILLLDVFVLMPIAMVAIYGIGVRLSGRSFGYALLALWLILPFLGVLYTQPGFHQRYTEAALPDAFGLTSLADFPSMVMLAVASYFCLRAAQHSHSTDGILAGLFIGVAIGVKPSSGLFLVGAVPALLVARSPRLLAAVVAGLAGPLLALVVWKWRGLGYLPLFAADHAVRLALGAEAQPLAALNWHRYLQLDWHEVNQNLLSLRGHFWSERLVEWVVIAGIVGLARRSLAACSLFGGWFLAFFLGKGSEPILSLDSGSLLHGMVQAIPAFVLLVAGVAFLLPRSAARPSQPAPSRAWAHPRIRSTVVMATLLLFAALPIALASAATRPLAGTSWLWSGANGPIPSKPMHVRARVAGNNVFLSWRPQRAAGAPVYYAISRGGLDGSTPCDSTAGEICPVVHLTHRTAIVDAPGPGRYDYRVLVGGSWVKDIALGDFYLASERVTVTVPRS